MTAPRKILFCGGGALGSHALMMARDLGPGPALAVVDFDTVETKNLLNQWFVKQAVGKNKAAALKMQMQNFFGLAVKDYTVELGEHNVETIVGDRDLVVDCFDNAASRRLVQDFVRERGIACLHGGLAPDGSFGAVRWDAHFKIDAEDIPGQPTCEGVGFLPLIVRTSAALVRSLQVFLAEERELHWNLTPARGDSFYA